MIRLAVKKAKGKEWFIIIAPKIFEEKEIGKTLASEPENLLNKIISLSAVDITNDLNKYYLKFKFRIVKIDGNKAIAEFDGSECLQDYISRMVLRRIRRIDTIQDLKTKDGIAIRVKVLTTISKKATSSIEKTIRDYVSKLVGKEVESLTLDEFLRRMISNELKTKVLKDVRKIYPVRNFEIRKTEIIR